MHYTEPIEALIRQPSNDNVNIFVSAYHEQSNNFFHYNDRLFGNKHETPRELCAREIKLILF